MNLSEITPGFAKALLDVQGSIEGAKKGKTNPAFRSKYADLGACWDACREQLQSNGIAVLQFPCSAPAGHVGLRTCLVFGKTGEVLSEEYCLPLKDPTSAQAGGSAVTYLRRYALCAIIGICPEDDDGNAASKPPAPVVAKPSQGGTKPVDGPSVQQLWDRFTVASDRAGRKEAFLTAKSSAVPEPEKTALLNRMAEAITAEAVTKKEGTK